ncbi:VOC family protein [Bacillus sp. OVS6]|nr:VOC family protein [Bacillus sp. OVS6]
MEFKLDHIVHFVDRHPLEAANMFIKQDLHAVMGGRHENWGLTTAYVISAIWPTWSFLLLKTARKQIRQIIRLFTGC